MKILNKLSLHIRRLYFKYKLNKNLYSGKLILVKDKHRGIGKTTMIIELSEKLDAPIITGYKSSADYINRMCSKNIAYSCNNIDSLRFKRFPNGVLIDEGLTLDKIQELRDFGIKIIIGFYYSNMLL